ncbi:MAG: insulinase family protein [Pseudomonadota bacterium]|nr:insulinase family protein [Pseudomonadota bacterium]
MASRVDLSRSAIGVSLAALALPTPASTRQPADATRPTTAWGIALTDVMPDPSIRYGRLANGMAYAIQRNTTPKGTASVRLNFRFGSIAEAEDERGLAHFIEHMAFNGTTNVAEGEMVRILERQGLAFGPDTNAQTGFDSTTYLLDLPATDQARIDTALFLMREVASEVKFDPAAVQRERGVIEGERRARDSFQLHHLTSMLNFQTPHTPYGKRLPIGTIPVITTAPAARLANLYHRYYRPELATLVIVGDVDPAAIETQVKTKFGDWRGVGPAGAPLPRGRVELTRPAAFGSYINKAMPNSANLTLYRPLADPADTVAERNEQIIRTIASAMFNRRLERLATAPGSVLLGGSMSVGRVENAALSTTVALGAKDGAWNAALATAEQEVRRATLHGFTAPELKQAMTNLTTTFETAAAQSDTRRNQALANSIVASIAKRDFVTTPAWRLAQYKAFAPSVTLARVNAQFRALWSGSAPVVFVSAKQPVGTPQQLASVFSRSAAAPVPPRADSGVTAFAYDHFGAAGTVVADQRIAAAGVRTIRFANNVRLNLKKTDFEQGRVRFEVRLAGGQLALPIDQPGLGLLMSATSSLGGTGKQSRDDLKQLLAGKVVTLGASVDDDAFVSAGGTTPADLALQLKLSAAYLLDPGYRPEAYDQWTNIVPLIDTQTRSQPQGIARALVPVIYANGDTRFGLPPRAALVARSLAEAKAAYAPIAASAPIDIGIVGDIDEAAAIAAVAQSFGALPARAAAAPDYAAARVVRFRTDRTPITLTHNGAAGQAMVIAAWPTDDDKDPVRVAELGLLSSALQIMLIDKVREELGDSYGASVGSTLSDTYPGFGVLNASAVVAPDKIDEVRAAIDAATAQLRSAPISADLLARARNPMLERAERALRENGAWTGLVTRAQSDPSRLDRLLGLRARIAAITADQLQATAIKYLIPRHRLELKIVAASAPATIAAAR